MKFLMIFILSLNLYATDIKVAVSANMSYAIDELKREFHKLNPNISVKTTIASSGKLTALISNNAPYGLFLSADTTYPNILYKNKKAITKPIIYAKGVLSLISIKDINLSRGLEVSTDNQIKKIAIANPSIAPYGKASVEAYRNLKIYKQIKPKFIYGNSISQTLFYGLNATDLAIVAKSSLFSPNLKNRQIYHKDINPKLYSPINQAMVLLKESKEYRKFYDFILSPKAKEIFKRYGYLTQ